VIEDARSDDATADHHYPRATLHISSRGSSLI